MEIKRLDLLVDEITTEAHEYASGNGSHIDTKRGVIFVKNDRVRVDFRFELVNYHYDEEVNYVDYDTEVYFQKVSVLDYKGDEMPNITKLLNSKLNF